MQHPSPSGPQIGPQMVPRLPGQGKSAMARSLAMTEKACWPLAALKALGALGRRFESCRPDLSHSKGSRVSEGPFFCAFWGFERKRRTKALGKGAMARSHCPMNEPLQATGGSIPLIASPESPTSRLPSRPLSFDKANPGPAQAICSCPCPCPDELLSAPAQRRRCFMAQAHLGAIAPKHASMRLLCPMASS